MLYILTGAHTGKADKTHPTDTLQTYHIDEVVVTSSVKETNALRTFPGSVSVLSPQTINGRRIEALKDMGTFVPNLYIPDYGAKLTSAIYIRGIGARSSGQSAGLYVDNVPYLDKSVFDFELTDIQRIEVFRGPQGVLYGRNAMGGIINIYTLSPFDFQGTKLTLSGGNYNQLKAKASHYLKASKTVGLSLSGYYNRNEGFFENRYTGQKADREESAGGRLKLEWRIKPSFSAAYTLSVDYVDQGAFPYGLYHPETGVVDPVDINDSCYYTRHVVTNSLFLAYRTKRFTLSGTTGFQYFKDNMLMDQDFSPKSIFTLRQKQTQKAISEEIAIKSHTSHPYQWSFGGYGFYTNFDIEGPVTFKEDGIKEILQPVFNAIKKNNPSMPFYLRITDKQLYIPGSFETPAYGLAFYHQSTYTNLFTKGLSLTAGIRLDYEKQEMHYRSNAIMQMGISRDSAGGTVAEIPNIEPTVMDEFTSQNFWQVLPKVSLKYACSPTTYTYLSVAKGYKTGGYNVQMSADLMQSQMQYTMTSQFMGEEKAEKYKPAPVDEVTAYKPEKSWNYEWGIRSELISDRLLGELTLFYMDIKDMQLTKFADSGNGRYLSNAGKASSLGVELTVRASITNNLTADVNYGFTRATFRHYLYEAKNDAGEIVQTDCKGNRIPYTPRHTLSIGMQYNKLLRNCWLDQLSVSLQSNGAGPIYWTELNNVDQTFYVLLNAKAGVRKGAVKLDIWSRNMTDTRYAAFYFESFKKPYIQKGKPFQIGAEISVTF
jgi:outer membrane receptor protein involved in Fe transport